MFDEDTLEARQSNEFEALNAIYGSELKDLRTYSKNKKKWVPLNLSLTLTPQQGGSGYQEAYVKIDLHIICAKNYPKVPPKIVLENGRGISNAVVSQLQKDLEERAKEMQGEEMIFQLAQYVEEFLFKHNKPAAKSFYDEMLKRQYEEEQKNRKAQEIEKDRERQVVLEEIRRREEILKQEYQLRKSSRFSMDNSDGQDESSGDSNSAENSNTNTCNHKVTDVVEFFSNCSRIIQRGCCIEHSHENSATYYGIDKESGELVAIKEWKISCKDDTELVYVQKQVSSIEQEFNYLAKLRHQNLVQYFSIKHDHLESMGKVVVQILREFVLGNNISSLFYSGSDFFDLDLVRHLVSGILNALDYLHRNNVVHKDVKASCVYLNNRGTVKVSNYSLDKKLCDLISHQQLTNLNKKTDIFKIGMLILSFIHGSPVCDTDIPKTVPVDLQDFLEKCLAADEKKRYTATQLLNHPFLKTPIARPSPKHVPEILSPERDLSPEIPPSDIKIMSHPNLSGQSRVKNEFEFLQHIGTGAYGDVIKVRNNLDGCYYAIKRIELNPKNKQLKKKILREVKLLSRLNHENVVRYYNSWIETALIENDGTDSSSGCATSVDTDPQPGRRKELTFKDDIEALAPPIRNVIEWPVSSDMRSLSAAQNSPSSNEDSSDEENPWLVNAIELSDSDSIEFLNDDDTEEVSTEISANKSGSKTAESGDLPARNIKEIQFMYIQMEFCEKSTLRNAIDNDLYLDENRMWRLFREIVEGLAHIHQQGMIHRDLKPVNIFLDSNDHVKIGDFGLATTSIRLKQSDNYTTSKSLVENDKEDVTGSLTGQVGTALYVAPELSNTTKAVYNQKVDIYSLGIILFEMCYRSLSTGMERIKILSQLRTREIIFPADFAVKENEKKEVLIRWLLNHDISKRPTSQELLQSEHIPPPVLEERELQELVRHTLSNPQLKAYKYLVASCFKQSVTPAQDITYDRDPMMPIFTKPSYLYDIVRKSLIKIFKLHGAQNLSTPLLMPKSKYYETVDTCVNLMTHSGNIVSLPHDLRVPFARYVAWNGITLLRRYSIERVYREKQVFGFVPRELYECAFDIVTPSKGTLMLDAEILCVVNEIINDLSGLKNKNFIIHINHTSLIRAILLHCGIKEKFNDVYQVLSDVREGKFPKFQLHTYFSNFGLSDNTIATLMNLISAELEINKAANFMQMITKRKTGEACQLAKQALQELKMIIQNAEALGVSFDILVTPGLVYNMHQYSGMICQFACELRKKHKKGSLDVLAAGGRYDNIIAEYRSAMERAGMLERDLKQYAVGISISLDKVVQALEEEQCLYASMVEFLDVIVCSVGTKPLLKEKAQILKSLWSIGIRCCLLEANSMEEIQDQCNELRVPHMIVLKENEQGTVRLRSWERDRFQEKTFTIPDLLDNLHRHIRNWNENNHHEPLYNNSSLTRSESKSNYIERNEHSHDANVNVLFVTIDKLSSNARRRYDNQIRSQLDVLFRRLNGDVIVLGLSVETNIVRTIASYLTFENEVQFQSSVKSVIDRHQRHKKYLLEVCDEIYEQKAKRTSPFIILYSLVDSFYKLLS